MKSVLACLMALLLIHTAAVEAAQEPVEIRAYVNDACIVADEPYYLPDSGLPKDGEQVTRALPFIGLIIGKIAEVLLGRAVNAAAGRISATAERKDTRYAFAKEMNLFRADLQPVPALRINAQLGCMTIVAAKFQPESASCTTAYLPREIARETMTLPQSQWKTLRTDDSLQNKLRRGNVCTDGEPRSIYESRFEFSEDGTAYRLKNAGYHIVSLLTTTDKKAERSVFYTLEISQPGGTDKHEALSTAWINLGKVANGDQVLDVDDDSAPWLRVPPLSVEARRKYEEHTKVYQDVYAEIAALERALVRNRRIQAGLEQRMATAAPNLKKEMKQEILKTQAQLLTLEAEYDARKAEYADLPKTPPQFMPVSIEVGLTETKSEKRALMALGKIVEGSSGMLASVAGTTATSLVTRDLDALTAAANDPGAELQAARAQYFDALVEIKTNASVPDAAADAARAKLALAKTRYNTARHVLGLREIE